MKKAYLFNIALLLVGLLFVRASHAQDYTRWELPEGVLARLGKGQAKAAVYSADGTRLAVNSSIGIWLYDAHTGTEIALIPKKNARAVALSSDGSTIASISINANMVRLWNADSGQLKTVLEGHGTSVYSVAFSPDGATLATGTGPSNTTVQLWDVDSGQLKAVLEGHRGSVYSVAFSPDGATLATGTSNTTVQLWDVDSGQVKAVLEGHRGSVYSVAFSPDGATLATGSWDTTVRLWDAASGQMQDTLQPSRTRYFVSYKPDGILVSRSGYSTTAAYTPDGASLVVVASNGTIWLWDVASDQMQDTLPGHTIWIESVAFSPDGVTLASAHRDGVWLWDAASGQRRTLAERAGSVNSVAFSPDGATLASSSSRIRLWDVTSGQIQDQIQDPLRGSESTGSVAFSPDGTILANGHEDGAVHLWDVASGRVKSTLLQGEPGAVHSVAFSPDGATLASGHRDNAIRLWDVASGQLKTTLEGQVISVAFSPDGTILASGSWDNTILLWDVASGQLKAILDGHAANRDDRGDCITSVAFSPDGTILASGSWDDTILLWDVASGQLKAILDGHADWVNSVAFSPDGTILASGSSDGTILLWDMLNIPDPTIDISVPLGFAVEKWSSLEPVAMDFITNTEYGTGIMGATIRSVASDDVEVLLWRYSADSEELVARIPTKLVNAVPTVRFDQTGLFDNKLFVTINAGPDGSRTTRVVIVDPNGEFRDARRNIYDENSTQASIEFIDQPNYPAGAYIYDADIGQGQSFYRLDESFNLRLIASHTLPSDRSAIDPMDLKFDPTGKYGSLLTLSDTDLNNDELSGLYQLQADGEWRTLVPPAPVSERQFQGIAFSNAGPLGSALYVADAATDNIWIASPKGHIEAFAVGFTNPRRIAIGPEGADMWVADQTGLYRIFSTDPADWEAAKATLPVASSLESNYPNPFNSSTQIPYRVSAPGPVRLVIYNVLGQPVRTLVDGVQAAGAYQISWDSRDHSGARVANGVYLYRLQAGEIARVRKMLVLE